MGFLWTSVIFNSVGLRFRKLIIYNQHISPSYQNYVYLYISIESQIQASNNKIQSMGAHFSDFGLITKTTEAV
jgi:hypothetical protein